RAVVELGLVGRRMVVALRSPRDARRSRRLLRDRALARHVHGELRGARDDAGRVRAPAGVRRGDVQSCSARADRWRRVHGDGEGAMAGGRRIPLAAGIVLGAVAAFGAWVASPLPDDVRRAEMPIGTGVSLTDRDGVLLRTTRASDGTRVRWLPLSEIR